MPSLPKAMNTLTSFEQVPAVWNVSPQIAPGKPRPSVYKCDDGIDLGSSCTSLPMCLQLQQHSYSSSYSNCYSRQVLIRAVALLLGFDSSYNEFSPKVSAAPTPASPVASAGIIIITSTRA
jgi:hypothetical protein